MPSEFYEEELTGDGSKDSKLDNVEARKSSSGQPLLVGREVCGRS